MSMDKNISRLSAQDLEKLRDKLAKSKRSNQFLGLYKRGLSELANNNIGKLWDGKFIKYETIESRDPMTKEKISFIANQLSLLPQPIKILDIGIGQAYLEQELAKRGISFDLSGIDISDLSIKRAKRKYNAVGFRDNALNMDKYFRSKTFDIIVAIEVIEHISPSEIFSFYKKVHKLLKDNGIFIISTPLNEGLSSMKENPNAHVREYTPAILNTEFRLSNFKIIKTKTLIAFKTLYNLKKMVSKLLYTRWKPNNIIIVAEKV